MLVTYTGLDSMVERHLGTGVQGASHIGEEQGEQPGDPHGLCICEICHYYDVTQNINISRFLYLFFEQFCHFFAKLNLGSVNLTQGAGCWKCWQMPSNVSVSESNYD